MWTRRRTACALAVATALATGEPLGAIAQDRHEFQLWSSLSGTANTAPLPADLSLWLDLHARRNQPDSVLLVRPGLGVRFFEWMSIHAGYAWVPTIQDETRDAVHEHRIWEQVTFDYRSDFGLWLQSRTRFEQRFSSAGSDVGFRLRQLGRLNWQPSPRVPLGLAVWDELFVGLNETDWGTPGGFDQNRLFLGPFLQMASWARFEAGYLLVYLDRGVSDLYAHTLSISLFVAVSPSMTAEAE